MVGCKNKYCLRLATDRRGRLYVHTDIRMLFSQKGDLEALNIELEKESQQHYELLSFTEMPQKPRFSPRK
uniref:Atos-like C-terminal domain-containing protein n=1 Tax=Parascaris equorum TaxID=6256 RepID=A0A914R9S7_PAREQ